MPSKYIEGLKKNLKGSLKDKPFQECFATLGLPSVEHRGLKDNMKEVYKNTEKNLPNYLRKKSKSEGKATKTKSMLTKRANNRCCRKLRRISISNRMLDAWKTLPEYGVTAFPINSFKGRFDKT